jgi:hypothetical protein
MAENAMDNDVDPSATGNGNHNDRHPNRCCERLMQA